MLFILYYVVAIVVLVTALHRSAGPLQHGMADPGAGRDGVPGGHLPLARNVAVARRRRLSPRRRRTLSLSAIAGDRWLSPDPPRRRPPRRVAAGFRSRRNPSAAPARGPAPPDGFGKLDGCAVSSTTMGTPVPMLPRHLDAIRGVGIDHDADGVPDVADGRQAVGMGLRPDTMPYVGSAEKYGVPRRSKLPPASIFARHRSRMTFPASRPTRSKTKRSKLEAFEMSIDGLDVCMRFCRCARPIDTGAEKLVEHVVLVGCHDEPGDRQAQHACNMASTNVAKITRRNGEKSDLFVIRLAVTAEIGL
jgi:hypothetical protein